MKGVKEDDPSTHTIGERSWIQEILEESYWERPPTYVDENMVWNFTEQAQRETLIERACRRRESNKSWRTVKETIILRRQKEHQEFRRVRKLRKKGEEYPEPIEEYNIDKQ
jgi:hypothetical protein